MPASTSISPNNNVDAEMPFVSTRWVKLVEELSPSKKVMNCSRVAEFACMHNKDNKDDMNTSVIARS